MKKLGMLTIVALIGFSSLGAQMFGAGSNGAGPYGMGPGNGAGPGMEGIEWKVGSSVLREYKKASGTLILGQKIEAIFKADAKVINIFRPFKATVNGKEIILHDPKQNFEGRGDRRGRGNRAGRGGRMNGYGGDCFNDDDDQQDGRRSPGRYRQNL